ncbi:MAG: hypothetical protein WD041_04845 [Nitriliruptoraceae bacterium]
MTAAARLVTIVATILATLLLPVQDASAHTRTTETTNVVSRLTTDPTPDDVTVLIHTGGLLVEVSNAGEQTLHVAGYDGEPYLRIGPDGVHENARSPAAWLNRTRFGDVAMPPDVDASAPPVWRHVSAEPRWIWHDHRTHWMSPQPPPFVEASGLARLTMQAEFVGAIGRAGAAAGTFATWTIPVMLDDESLELHGVMEWVDPPSPLPWLGLAILLLAFGLIGVSGDPGRSLRRAALLVGIVAAVNTIHLVDDLVAFPTDPLDELFGLLHTSLFLTLGLGGAAWARWASQGRVLALGIGSGAVLYHQGLIHLPMLFASQYPTIWPDGLVRTTISLGLLQVIPVGIVIVRSLTAHRRAPVGDGPGPGSAEGTSPTGQDTDADIPLAHR